MSDYATALHDRTEQAKDAALNAFDSLEKNPLGIVAGGIVLGAILGALLPRSDRERKLFAPVGRELGARARSAFDAAREAGRSELSNVGLTKGAAKTQVRGILDGIVQAATTAGTAAADSVKKKA